MGALTAARDIEDIPGNYISLVDISALSATRNIKDIPGNYNSLFDIGELSAARDIEDIPGNSGTSELLFFGNGTQSG